MDSEQKSNILEDLDELSQFITTISENDGEVKAVNISTPPPIPVPHRINPLPILLKIPGSATTSSTKKVIFNGSEVSISDVVADSRASDFAKQAAAIKTLGELTELNPHELHHVVSTLYSISHDQSINRSIAIDALQQLLIEHISSSEALNLSLQIIKKSEHNSSLLELISTLTEQVALSLEQYQTSRPLSRSEFFEARHILLKALEVDALRNQASNCLKVLLEDRNEALKLERKEVANNILAILRSVNVSDDSIQELRKLASVVFSVGYAPPSSDTAKRLSDTEQGSLTFVTALQAENNKQFGLATALETRKASKIRGRAMSIDEYAASIRSGPYVTLSKPTNQRWFTRAEWNTALRLLSLGTKDDSVPPLEIAALMHILATRVKVDDEASKNFVPSKADHLSQEERDKLLRECRNILRSNALSQEALEQTVLSFESQLLGGIFTNWRYQLAHRETNTSFSSNSSSVSSKDPNLAKLIKDLITNDNTSVILKLTTNELHKLRQAKGLSLEEFKTLTSRLRSRAVSCDWTRAAILDIVRAPHDKKVTAGVRTAVLGSLVNDARKASKLTALLEKEVFAVSAEIPELPFLSPDDEFENEGDELTNSEA